MAEKGAAAEGINFIPRSVSVADLWERGVRIIRGSKVIVDQAKNAKMVLGTSKGRDDICSTIQYIAKFVYTCEVHSNIPEVQEQIRYLPSDQTFRNHKRRQTIECSHSELDEKKQEDLQPLQIYR